jgi:prepilin-type N-terminal cleavage/methylation domain-containing protein
MSYVIRARTSHSGFTLIELLVALALLAITSALAFRGITSVGEHRNRVEGQRLRSVQIEQTFAQLQADMDHLMTMTGATSGTGISPIQQRIDGLILLRRPRALVADTVTQATANDATIDAVRYQATSTGLVRTLLGRGRDPIDMQGRVLNATVISDSTGKATEGLSQVTLLPEARGLALLVWSQPVAATLTPGGTWVALAQFNEANNNSANANQAVTAAPAAAVASAASAPASGASAPAAPAQAAPSIASPRATKISITLENGAILERIYMAGPNG